MKTKHHLYSTIFFMLISFSVFSQSIKSSEDNLILPLQEQERSELPSTELSSVFMSSSSSNNIKNAGARGLKTCSSPVTFGVRNAGRFLGDPLLTTPLAATYFCNDPTTYQLEADIDTFRANIPNQAPAYLIKFSTTNANTDNSVEFMRDGVYVGGYGSVGLSKSGKPWTGSVTPSNNYIAQPYWVSPTATNQIEVCVNTIGANMPYEVIDPNSGLVLSSGTINGSVIGCTIINVTPQNSITGTASWTTTCPAGAILSFSNISSNSGVIAFLPRNIPSGTTCDITYTWNDGLGNCSGSQTQTISVVSPYNATSLSYPTPVCKASGGTLTPTLNADAGGSYQVLPASGLSINTTSGNINVAASTPGIYRVGYLVGSSSSCYAIVEDTIEILPDVNPAWTTPGTVCESAGNINLNTSITGTVGGTWSGIGITGSTFNPTGLTGNISITYSVGTSPCEESVAHNINVVPDVDPSWTNPATLCGGSGTINLNTLLTGTSGGTWSGTGVTGNTFNPSALSGNITITYTVGSPPCVETSAQIINIVANVNPAWTLPSTVCETDGIINLNTLITGTSGGAWNGTGVTGSTFDPSGLNGPISVTYTVGTAPCEEFSTQNITVNPADNATISYSSGSYCLVDSNPTPTLTGTTGGTFSINNGGTINPTTGQINIASSGAGNYTITYTTSGVCPTTAIANVILTSATDATITQVPPLCDDTGLITLNAVDGGGTWSGSGVVNGTFNPALAGIGSHVITYTIGGSCGSVDTMTIVVTGVTAVINATPVTGAPPLEVTFGNGSSSPASYLWNFGDGNTSVLFEPKNTYTANGDYLISLIVTEGGCSDTDYVTIVVIGEPHILIPNVFTPNGDKMNDVFTVEAENIETIEGVIYNRWGQMMFSWDHLEGYWDGTTLSGSEAPDGTYFYIIKAKDFEGKEYLKKGGLSLIR